MNTKYDIGDKVWIATYRNDRCMDFPKLEVLPIRDGFNDLSLIAEPKEFLIQEIRITDKGVRYGTNVCNYKGRRYFYGIDGELDIYMVWFEDIDIFNSEKECQEEKEIQNKIFMRKRTGKCTCCCCCCNCK